MPDVGIEPTMPEATVLQTASPPWGLSGLAGVEGLEPSTFRLTVEYSAIELHAIRYIIFSLQAKLYTTSYRADQTLFEENDSSNIFFTE